MKTVDELLDQDLQVVEVQKEKTNEEKMRELLDRMNLVLQRIEQRKKQAV